MNFRHRPLVGTPLPFALNMATIVILLPPNMAMELYQCMAMAMTKIIPYSIFSEGYKELKKSGKVGMIAAVGALAGATLAGHDSSDEDTLPQG